MVEPEFLAASVAAFEHRLLAQQPISLEEVKELERQTEPYRKGPHYQLAQRVRKLAHRLGHVAVTQWEQLKQTPVPVFNMAERSYIGRLTSTKDAPVEVKVVFDHLFLTTNYRVSLNPYDLVKITHRFNREGRLDLIDARLKQTKRLYLEPDAPTPAEDAIFHLVQVFAFKDKQPELAWAESRSEYFIRLRQIAALFYDLGLTHEEQQYRHLIQHGHRLAKELHRAVQAGALQDVRVTRAPFHPFHKLREDEAACYIASRAALLEPKVTFNPERKGGHLGDLCIKYGTA
ncbi:MAG: hypothetical protein RL514_747 [Verrucomicrobiota bacterium]|jgi:hypothetical protein